MRFRKVHASEVLCPGSSVPSVPLVARARVGDPLRLHVSEAAVLAQTILDMVGEGGGRRRVDELVLLLGMDARDVPDIVMYSGCRLMLDDTKTEFISEPVPKTVSQTQTQTVDDALDMHVDDETEGFERELFSFVSVCPRSCGEVQAHFAAVKPPQIVFVVACSERLVLFRNHLTREWMVRRSAQTL